MFQKITIIPSDPQRKERRKKTSSLHKQNVVQRASAENLINMWFIYNNRFIIYTKNKLYAKLRLPLE